MKSHIAFLFGLALLGCSQAGPDADAQVGSVAAADPALSEGVEVDVETLHKISVAGEELKFQRTIDTNGKERLFLTGLASANSTQSVFERIEAKNEDATLLEIFKAVAPPGEEPNAALERFHDVQTRGFGRPDSSVRKLTFDPAALVQKSASACTTFADSSAVSQLGGNNSAAKVNIDMPNGGDAQLLCRKSGVDTCLKMTTQGQLVALCVDGPGDAKTRTWWRHNASTWTRDSVFVIRPPGTMVYYWFPSTDSVLDVQVLGLEIKDMTATAGPAYYGRARASTF
jgi:hypothetical protein